jgi:glucose/arabinose dehydrogenase
MRWIGMLVAGVTCAALLAGCSRGGLQDPPPPGVQPVGVPEVVASGLGAPWSMVRLESGSTLVSERDSGVILELQEDGELREVATVPGVAAGGEGGLLGLAVADDMLFAYLSTATDNRIESFELRGGPGSYTLGEPTEVLTGIARASNHNGGRLAIGPDGMLYATVGDASQPKSAQDRASLNGKILRMELDGSAPSDNPTPGSLVFSLGHRNPQGLAWDDKGRLWAAEFGQDTWDELNLIEPGGNYGWPVVEGIAEDTDFIDPAYQWATDDASPSGLAFVDDTLFMAALGGERLWVIYLDREIGVDAVEYFTGEYGRLRDVTPGTDGSLWMLTNNTDGRGTPQQGDDRIIQVRLNEFVEG